MKKATALILALLMMMSSLVGCGKKNDAANADKTDKLKVVTTIFPEYDWVKEILGDKAGDAEITMLLDKGGDLHSYQPTADDIDRIADCDLFIYVGGESDDWVKDALKNSMNKDMKVINLLDVLKNSIKTEETKPGMQAEEEHKGGKNDEHEEKEYDEHVWLSLKNVKPLVEKISEDLQELDPENKEIYASNTKAYVKKLSDLDDKYRETVDTAKRKTVLFGDRFPFRYLTDAYGLNYYAAFAGCSAETEASFKTVSFLAKKMDELKLPCVLTIEGSKHKIAETIVKNTAEKNQKVRTMDSMQSTTSKDADKGATYLSIMEKNLSVLKKALN